MVSISPTPVQLQAPANNIVACKATPAAAPVAAPVAAAPAGENRPAAAALAAK